MKQSIKPELTTVKEAASFLDWIDPEWPHKINVKTLDLASCTNCILGQLYGDYSTGTNRIFPDGYGIKVGYPFVPAMSCNPDIHPEWLTEINNRLMNAPLQR